MFLTNLSLKNFLVKLLSFKWDQFKDFILNIKKDEYLNGLDVFNNIKNEERKVNLKLEEILNISKRLKAKKVKNEIKFEDFLSFLKNDYSFALFFKDKELKNKKVNLSNELIQRIALEFLKEDDFETFETFENFKDKIISDIFG